MTIKKITLTSLQKLKDSQTKITCLTCYDASFARLLSAAGTEILLVGDTLGMIIGGHDTTIPVTIDDMVYHTANVKRANPCSLILGDMPFLSYSNVPQALENAGRLMQAGAEMIKMEGGSWLLPIVEQCTQKGIPFCGHLGLTPQSVNVLGGFKIQGREPDKAKTIVNDALALQKAGAKMLVLECVPYSLAQEITSLLTIPVLGIGAGPYCDGQILVTTDMLGISQEDKPYKFVHNFLIGQTNGIQGAVAQFIDHVKTQKFPTLEHSFA